MMTPEQIEIANEKYGENVIRVLPLSTGRFAVLDRNYRTIEVVSEFSQALQAVENHKALLKSAANRPLPPKPAPSWAAKINL